ncbi:nuclear transport factor 2 family protein [Allosalinactinospora lopnorensis]|uniref:nuclear transport factor 2 family protein n=1 Tax=Allosalinactinospora lopnorensis TaxID=1352348 RepID=UPI000623DA50|nr:nuclear transport factor 2 family protein [Allosalinactinospora lopnorensis]
MTTNVEILRKLYADANDNNMDAVLAVMAPDVEWIYPDGLADYGIGNAKGREEVRALLNLAQRLFSSEYRNPEDFVESGDRVVAFGTYHLRGARSGVDGVVRFAHYFHMADGQVKNLAVYYDSAELRRVLEPTTSGG